MIQRLAIGILMMGCYAHAEKKITVKVVHPPSLATAFAGKFVQPGTLTGDCAKEFGDLLFEDMRAHGVAMAGGQSATAAAAPAMVLSIDVSRCEGRPLPAILGEGLPAAHIARTEGWFVAQLRAVDAASGREVASVAVHGHAQKENQSQATAPEWPAASELKSLAVRQGLAEARRMYATWTESRELPFMDGKECHMKQAYDLAKAGDFDGVARLLKGEVESCNPGAKAGMEAWYDLGLAYMQLRNFDGAVMAFEKALPLNGGKLVDGLLDECRKQVAPPKPAPVAPGPPVQTGILMTNDFVIKLIDGNVAEAEVIQMIANQPGRFSLEPADIAKLRAANVPDSVIAAMRDKK
jgi:hypothetical protein